MYTLDDENRVRICTGIFGRDYCDHGVSFDDPCQECEKEVEDVYPEDVDE